MDKQIAEMYADSKVNEAIHALIGKIDADPRETDNTCSYFLPLGAGQPGAGAEALGQAKGLIKIPGRGL